MALTEIEKEWDRKRADLKDKKDLADFDAYCERSRGVYRAMKQTDLWEPGLWSTHYYVMATCDIIKELIAQDTYNLGLRKFWDLLQELLNAVIQGKKVSSPSVADTMFYFDRTPVTQHIDRTWSDMLWKIIIVKKLVDAGADEFTPDSATYLLQKWEEETDGFEFPEDPDNDDEW